MGFGIPNEADATYGVQARLFSSHIADLVAGIGGTGVRSGCACSVTTGLTVAVAGGVLSNDVTVTSGSVTLDAADGTNPRVDIVRAAVANGALSKVTGTPGTDPVEPAAGAGYVKLWAWYVPSGLTALTSAMGTDRRLAPVDLSPLYIGLPSTSFIYNSIGSQEGTRYNSWSDLIAGVDDARYGGPRNIVFERNETVPAGTYDLTDVTLLGNGFGLLNGGLQLTFAAGCHLSNNILRVGAGLTVVYAGTSYLMDGTEVNGATKSIVLSDRAAIACTGSGGAIIGLGSDGGLGHTDPCSGEAQLVAAQGENCMFLGTGAFPGVNGHLVAYRSSAGGSRSFVFIDNGWGTVTPPNAVRIDGANNVEASLYLNSPTLDVALSTDPSYLLTSGGAGPGVLTATRVAYNSAATRVAYTPAVTGNWVGADPTTIAQALDRIAAALGPIA